MKDREKVMKNNRKTSSLLPDDRQIIFLVQAEILNMIAHHPIVASAGDPAMLCEEAVRS